MIRLVRSVLGFVTLVLGIVLFGVYAGLAIRHLGGNTGSAVARSVLFQPYTFPWDIHALYYISALLTVLGMVMTQTLSIFCALLGSAFLLGYGASAAGWAAQNGPAGSLAAPLRGVTGALGSDLVFLGMGISALLFGLLLRGASGSGAKLVAPRPGGGKPGSSGGITPPSTRTGIGLPTCPSCGKAVLRGAKTCRHCGATIEGASASATPEPTDSSMEETKLGAPPPDLSTPALLDRLESMPDEPSDESGDAPSDLPPDPEEKSSDDNDSPPEPAELPRGKRLGTGGSIRMGDASATALLAKPGPNPAAFFSPLLGLSAAGAIAYLATQCATWSDARIGALACGAAWCGGCSALLGLTGLGKARGKKGLAFAGLLLGTLGGGAGGALLLLGS